MPLKDRSKQDIAAKVQEIKLKQQRWMNEKKMSGQRNKNVVKEMSSPAGAGHFERVEEWVDSSTSSPATSAMAYQPGNYETPSEAAQDFNLVADQIISRVKNNLGFHQYSDTKPQPSQKANTSGPIPGQQPMVSHLCSKCSHLMVGPHHTPVMLIPCGHSLCEACSRGAVKCYLCKTDISGQTTNITLQQLIITKNSSSSPSNSANCTRLERQKDQDEKEERQSLLLRREAMQEEMLNIEESINGMENKIQNELDQISSIERKETDIFQKISSLQGQLVKLQEHKEEFKQKIAAHQNDIVSAHQKLDLINETVKYLTSRLSPGECRT
ncbi:uncharacterized protein [Watersipora subatra]|uniref:uncharacterized protein n=1 Tax=Watersipora subatra TaxID=2589382 RepID=UPI00355C3A32